MSTASVLRTKKYFAMNKPYGVLSQFTDPDGRRTIKSVYNFPEDVYPVGRLDMDSEGLMILTNDKMLTDYLLNPKYRHEKEYFVQVEGIPERKALLKLENGVVIAGKKTLPAKAGMIVNPDFEPRVPPIRIRKNIPDAWISLVITEGRNRQVRKMTAAVGYPTLRLVRVRIKNLTINGMKPGEVRELTYREVEDLKK